ncbi:MAG: helix-turn-helix domain-containing protein [Chloroflexi bacterium]|nr:helix-turn-helix domain-containing protein [Chloroflexota bacterium]
MAKHIELPQDEKTELEQLIKSGEHKARVLLLLDRKQGEKRTLSQVAEATMLSNVSVSHIKWRYFEGGLDRALYDKLRPGRPVTKMTGDIEAQFIALTCSDPPEGYDQWTLRLLAEGLVKLELVASISHVAVGETLKNELRPWQVKSRCMPKPGARFVAKMEDVLSVYERPYDPKRPMVCLDEIQKALRSTPKGYIPIKPGQSVREDYEYQ